MRKIAVLGAQWGDEGKGAITHHFSKEYRWVVRFNGGPNAGHTIYRDGKKYVHNLLPSIDFRDSKVNAFLGSGMVISLEKLAQEVIAAQKDFIAAATRIYVDPNAFVILPEHVEQDKAQNGHIGSTNRGIGPAYVSKYSRNGLRVAEVLDTDEYAKVLKGMGVQFRYAVDLLDDFRSSHCLFEGAQGVLLDINHGTYPYVSCSDATVSGIGASGFNSIKLDTVYGVAKCYSTRVGNGPFPTELFGEEEENLRKIGKEYGATTGRPRRVGWLDLPALKYSCDVAGITDLIITKLDILNARKFKVCIGYEKKPVSPSDFFNAKPIYTDFDGWTDASCDSAEVDRFLDLIHSYTGRPVRYISCGVGPNDIIRIY